jgi:hypothetical protein
MIVVFGRDDNHNGQFSFPNLLIASRGSLFVRADAELMVAPLECLSKLAGDHHLKANAFYRLTLPPAHSEVDLNYLQGYKHSAKALHLLEGD